jgi:hypothetical protein
MRPRSGPGIYFSRALEGRPQVVLTSKGQGIGVSLLGIVRPAKRRYVGDLVILSSPDRCPLFRGPGIHFSRVLEGRPQVVLTSKGQGMGFRARERSFVAVYSKTCDVREPSEPSQIVRSRKVSTLQRDGLTT